MLMALLEQYFDMALETPGGIQKLRELILTLAMQGKLVSQDPNDPPTSELLKKIKAEEEKLMKEGKIKKQKQLPPISKNEIPYMLPDGWITCRLGEIHEFLNGFAFKSNTYVSHSDYQIIRLGNVKNNRLLLKSNPIFIPEGNPWPDSCGSDHRPCGS